MDSFNFRVVFAGHLQTSPDFSRLLQTSSASSCLVSHAQVNATELPEGLHYGEVMGEDASAPWRGPLFRYLRCNTTSLIFCAMIFLLKEVFTGFETSAPWRGPLGFGLIAARAATAHADAE